MSILWRAKWMAPDGVSDCRWKAVLWRHVFSAAGRVWSAELPARAVEYCGRLQAEARGCGRAGGDGGIGHRSVRVVFRKERASVGGCVRGDSAIGSEDVRSAAWRFWTSAEVSSSN